MVYVIFVLITYLLLKSRQASTFSFDTQNCQKDDFELFLAKEGGSKSCSFMVKLADIIAKENPEKNIVISPASIILALALLERGAEGETRQKIQEVTADLDKTLELYTIMLQSLQHFLKLNSTEKSKLSIANAVFTKEGSGVKNEYKLALESCFDAEVGALPADSEEGVNLVNKWVSGKTYEKIPALFAPGSITPDTHTVLVNAIYMIAQWKYQFNKTEEGPFFAHGKLEDEQTVTYAKIKTKLEFYEQDGYQAVVLPYHGDELEMTLIKKIDYEGFENYGDKKKAISNLFIATMKSKDFEIVDLSIPKFSFRYKADLKPIFENLGLEIIFSDKADFSRMTEVASKVDEAVHEAFIKVDEKGTEAAGATGITVKEKTSLKPSVLTLKFDKPFIFFITHKLTGAHLFAGQVNFIENIE